MNQFDRVMGSPLSGLGFLKKLTKKYETAKKKGFAKLKEPQRKIDRVLVPSKVREIGRELDKKGVPKLAAAAALTVVSMGAGSGILAATAVKVAAGMGASALSKSGTKDYQEYKTDKLIAETAAEEAAILANAVQSLPAFQQLIDEFRSQGYSDREIAAHWVESRAYYESALVAAETAIEPAVSQAVQQSGVAQSQQSAYTQELMHMYAQRGVEQTKEQVSGKSSVLLPILAGAAALIFMG